MKIYSSTVSENKKKIKLLGITLYKKTAEKKCFLGICYYRKNKDIIELENKIKLLENIERANTTRIRTMAMTAKQHTKVFPGFKNIHKGKTAVLIATGPTMLDYVPIQNAVVLGVNSAFKKHKLDYLFSTDFKPIKNFAEDIKQQDFIKFFGQVQLTFPHPHYTQFGGHIPDSFIDECKNAYKYYVENRDYTTINQDITTQLLPDLGSCVFQAAYFALYTGVKKIYIVGCDCAPNGHWNEGPETQVKNLLPTLLKSWRSFGEFVKNFYPGVELISINPIGLKGIFRDVYTKPYIEHNPGEINKDEYIEYLEDIEEIENGTI